MERGSGSYRVRLQRAPQRGQDGSTQGHGQRDLHGGCSVAQICSAACEAAGVASAQDGAGQGLPTQVTVQAPAGVQGQRASGVEL